MLCYRCGSHVPDGTEACGTCGQKFALGLKPGPIAGFGTGTRRHLIAVETAPYKVGDVIAGRYEIRENIGAGPVGWIFKCIDRDIDVDVALKVVSPRLLQVADERRALSRELRTVRRISHANVVRVYEDGEDGDRLFFTMQYLEGLTLRRIWDLRRQKGQVFALREVEPIVQQIAHALDAAHELSSHGDLKPDNVVILPDLVKLTDFGLANALPRAPFMAAQKAGGVHRYLAPEFLHGERIDPRADVFSLGVIVGEMLTGAPFEAQSFELLARNPALPKAVDEVFRRAVSLEASDRFARAGDFAQAFAEAAGLAVPRPMVTATPPAVAAPAAPSVPAPAPAAAPARESSEEIGDDEFEEVEEAPTVRARVPTAESPNVAATAPARREITAVDTPPDTPRLNLPPKAEAKPSTPPAPAKPVEAAPVASAAPTPAKGDSRAPSASTPPDGRSVSKVTAPKADSKIDAKPAQPVSPPKPEPKGLAEAPVSKLEKGPRVDPGATRVEKGAQAKPPSLEKAADAPRAGSEPPKKGGPRSIVGAQEPAWASGGPAPVAPSRPAAAPPPTPLSQKLPIFVAVGLLVAIAGFLLVPPQESGPKTRGQRRTDPPVAVAEVVPPAPAEAPAVAAAPAAPAAIVATAVPEKAPVAAPTTAAREPVRKAPAEDRAAARAEVAKKQAESLLAAAEEKARKARAEAALREQEKVAEARAGTEKALEKAAADKAAADRAAAEKAAGARAAERAATEKAAAEKAAADKAAAEKAAADKADAAKAAAPKADAVVAASGPKSCPSGMRFIPAGKFKLGAPNSDPLKDLDDLDLEEVETEPYCIDAFEAPNRKGIKPTTQFTWKQAADACRAQRKRLCSEEEWERACKGPGGARFPYGKEFDAAACNSSDAEGSARTVAFSGVFNGCGSGYGIFDLSGNVAEWTATSYEEGGSEKVVKGGAADRPDFAVRCAARARRAPGARDKLLGFRCCADPK